MSVAPPTASTYLPSLFIRNSPEVDLPWNLLIFLSYPKGSFITPPFPSDLQLLVLS